MYCSTCGHNLRANAKFCDQCGAAVISTTVASPKPQAQDHIQIFKGHTGPVIDTVFSQDNQLIATASSDKTVRLWNVSDGKMLHNLVGHRGEIVGLGFDSKSEVLYSWVNNIVEESVLKWDVSNGDLLDQREIDFHNTPRPYASRIKANFLPDYQTIFYQKILEFPGNDYSTRSEYALGILKLPDFKLAYNFDGKRMGLVNISPSGDTIVSVPEQWVSTSFSTSTLDTSNQIIDVWMARKQKQLLGGYHTKWKKISEIYARQGHTEPISELVISPNDELLVTAGRDTRFCVWRLADQHILYKQQTHPDIVRSMAFSHNNELLATASGSIVRIWQMSDGKLIKTFDEHRAPVNKVRFSPDNKALVSVSDDHTACLWWL